jgi:AbrB family looped-hinge helix DNA binding protein
MVQKVKKGKGRVRDKTTVSSKHQVTIPAAAFRGARLKPGDTLKVAADGAGRITLTRVEELADRYSGSLDTNGALRDRVEQVRGEWR